MHRSWAGSRLQPTGKRNLPDGQQPNHQPASNGLLNNEFSACRQPAFEEQQECGGKNNHCNKKLMQHICLLSWTSVKRHTPAVDDARCWTVEGK
jgi:hypothetical protein